MYQQFTNVYSATEVILIVGPGHLYAVFSRAPARKRPGSLPKAGRGGCYNILRQLLYFEGEFCDRCYTFPASIVRQKLYFRSISVPFLPNCTGRPRVWWAFCDRTYTGTGILRLFLYFHLMDSATEVILPDLTGSSGLYDFSYTSGVPFHDFCCTFPSRFTSYRPSRHLQAIFPRHYATSVILPTSRPHYDGGGSGSSGPFRG